MGKQEEYVITLRVGVQGHRRFAEDVAENIEACIGGAAVWLIDRTISDAAEGGS